jgi:hypothetical protein
VAAAAGRGAGGVSGWADAEARLAGDCLPFLRRAALLRVALFAVCPPAAAAATASGEAGGEDDDEALPDAGEAPLPPPPAASAAELLEYLGLPGPHGLGEKVLASSARARACTQAAHS